MSGIPVYTSSPINTGAKASGVTPQTSSLCSNPGPPPTTATTSTSSYPSAQPGAVPVPMPTSSTRRYGPVQPTTTTKTDSDGPPPPQPGAFPAPVSKSIPPPPKAGERYQPPSAPPQPQSMPQPYPPQMGIPPPTSAYGSQPPTSATTSATTSTSSSTYPVVIPAGEYGAPRRSLEHPPGYQQNTYASELTSDQRRIQDSNSSTEIGGVSENVGGIDTENIWNTAKQWASTAGSKIAETEAEVWRRINKQ